MWRLDTAPLSPLVPLAQYQGHLPLISTTIFMGQKMQTTLPLWTSSPDQSPGPSTTPSEGPFPFTPLPTSPGTEYGLVEFAGIPTANAAVLLSSALKTCQTHHPCPTKQIYFFLSQVG